jgi:outer membrane protein W
MKRIIIVMFVLGAAVTLPQNVSAQEKFKMEINYNVALPTGSFKNDFIENTSYRGITGEVKYQFNPKFSLGLQSGFQNFYQKYPRQEYKLENNQTISAVVTNNLEIVPVLVKGTYYPTGNSKTIVPYLSGAAGVNIINFEQYVGEFGGTDVSLGAAVQAGAGIKIPFGTRKQNGISLGATYNYAAYNKNNQENLNNIGLNLGVIFPLK